MKNSGFRRLCEGGFGLFRQRLERLRLMHGQIRQYFAVNLDAGLRQAVHEARIGDPGVARGGVNALDPQRAESALLGPAIAISILAGLLDRLIGDTEGVLTPAVIALGAFDDFFVPGVGGRARGYACHLLSPYRSYGM